MTRFLRSAWPLLGAAVRRRLALSAAVATGLAVLESLGLLLIVPLVASLTDEPAGGAATDLLENVVGSAAVESPGRLGTVVVAVFVLKAALAVAYLRWAIGAILQAEARAAADLLATYLHAPYSWLLRRSTTGLQSTIQEGVRRIYGEALVGVVGAAADVLMVVAIAAVLLALQPVPSTVAILYFALVAIGYQRLIHGRAARAGNAILEDTGRAHGVVQEALGTYKTVSLGGLHDFFRSRYLLYREASARNLRTLMFLYQAPRYYLEVALILAVALMGYLLYSRESDGEALGALALFAACGFRVLPSVNRILVARAAAEAATSIATSIHSDLERLRYDLPSDTEDLYAPLGGSITVRGVCFAYDGAPRDAVHNVDFTIAPGEGVAVVGSSGAGKSTLVDLLLGLLEPSEGSIAVGGQPLQEVLRRWQRSIGYVPQDCLILDDTLRNNIALGVPSDQIDEDAVRLALQRAELDLHDLALPLGERGSRLSAGQRQRVGIARALYHDPSVIVFDEATSNLDGPTEGRILRTIDRISAGRTTLMVTHRINTTRHVDRIVVMRDGSVVADGPYDVLERSSTAFRDLLLFPGVESEPNGSAVAGDTPS